jgi:type II secretory pathway predicted ATPase ExeA
MPENTDNKNHPTIKALQSHRERLGLKDAAFHRHYLRSICSAATWSLLQSGTYAGDAAGMIADLAGPLAMLNDQADAAATRRDAGADIVPLSHTVAALTALKGCADVVENRLVAVLLPTGGGKSTLSRRICELYGSAAVPVQASETWRGSYLSPLKCIAAALGINGALNTPLAAETAVMERLRGGERILVIDEAHNCGPQALNLIKLLLNDGRARTRVVLLAVPKLWDRVESAAHEEEQQLRRRTAAKIKVTEMPAADARLFLAARLPGFAALDTAAASRAVELCVRAANRFGLYDTLSRVCLRARREAGGAAPALAHIETAINHVEALRS